jgi:hypothetical protein
LPYILETDDLLSLHAIRVYRVSDDDINNGLGRREKILQSMPTVELQLFSRMSVVLTAILNTSQIGHSESMKRIAELLDRIA